jgi:hypothetical protein
MKKRYVSIEILEAEETENGYLVNSLGSDEVIEVEKEAFEKVAQPINRMNAVRAAFYAIETKARVMPIGQDMFEAIDKNITRL